MNPDLNRLHPYPFEKLRDLKDGIVPPADKSPIALSIGEPKHSPPHFVVEEVITHLHGLENVLQFPHSRFPIGYLNH